MGLIRQEAATLVGFLAFACVLLTEDIISPENLDPASGAVVLTLLIAVMMWCAFNVVHHAECLADLLGEPYGTLILTLSVIGIEVALIAAVMLTGGGGPTVARDTMFSVLMIAMNGLVGLSLIIGGLKHRTQAYNLQGANAFLSVLVPLAAFALVLPRFTASAPGGELSLLQAVFAVVMSVILYGVFLTIQTVSHSEIFRQPVVESAGVEGADDSGGAAHGHAADGLRSAPFHFFALLAALLPIILLSKELALYVNVGLLASGAPIALGGFLVAAIILTPEGLSAVQAAADNQLQRSVNITLGSAVATIGLTVPAVLAIGWFTGIRVELGLEMTEILLLLLTILVSVITFVSPRTNMLQGMVHLALFAAYVMLIFDVHG